MGRIVVTEFVSLDGVVEDPGGAENFKYGGWSFEISRGDEGDTFKLDETMSSEALLLGRVTYEGFAAAWPSSDEGEFADKFNSMPKYVVSSTLDRPRMEQHDRAEGRRRGRGREAQAASRTATSSSTAAPQLVQTLLEHDLVDEFRLMVFPVVLGCGKRLFGETTDKKPLRLVRLAAWSATVSPSSSTSRRANRRRRITETGLVSTGSPAVGSAATTRRWIGATHQ